MVIQSLFFLEYILFKTYTVKNEVFLADIKLKWLYEQLTKSDELDKSLYNLKPLIQNNKSKKYLLNLLSDFSGIIDFSDKKEFFQNFKKFNCNFNKILNLFNKNFTTSYKFQILYYFYVNEINQIKDYNELFLKSEKKIDLAESVFIEIFLKKCTFNSTKISKFKYLFYLLKELIKK
tara:strand:+ start:3506 stop:4036 length:531 start_codon:yes stop_codon:yes gene_type:complete